MVLLMIIYLRLKLIINLSKRELKNFLDAEEAYLILKSRNREYKYVIKEKEVVES